MALGEAKAPIVKKMVQGDVTPLVPASILQSHPQCGDLSRPRGSQPALTLVQSRRTGGFSTAFWNSFPGLISGGTIYVKLFWNRRFSR